MNFLVVELKNGCCAVVREAMQGGAAVRTIVMEYPFVAEHRAHAAAAQMNAEQELVDSWKEALKLPPPAAPGRAGVRYFEPDAFE